MHDRCLFSLPCDAEEPERTRTKSAVGLIVGGWLACVRIGCINGLGIRSGGLPAQHPRVRPRRPDVIGYPASWNSPSPHRRHQQTFGAAPIYKACAKSAARVIPTGAVCDASVKQTPIAVDSIADAASRGGWRTTRQPTVWLMGFSVRSCARPRNRPGFPARGGEARAAAWRWLRARSGHARPRGAGCAPARRSRGSRR